jgi:hypothetical protein
MIGFATKFQDDTAKVKKQAEKATVQALYKAAYAIMTTAKGLIKTSPQASPPGEPPHTRAGQLRQAIRYEVNRAEFTAYIGPQASQMGPAAQPMEHGGTFRGERYPERPFMGPALDKNREKIPAFLAGTVNDT